ncbi:MAG: hypothetical protein M5U28_00995 [Sandaracinaceae bacterium]|nr:hypothetical protein [Sandaracinaceae bacterium]
MTDQPSRVLTGVGSMCVERPRTVARGSVVSRTATLCPVGVLGSSSRK